jgi:hypothetical protein
MCSALERGEWKPGDILECFDLADRIQTLESASTVGRCRVSVSKPMLKAPIVSALEARIS